MDFKCLEIAIFERKQDAAPTDSLPKVVYMCVFCDGSVGVCEGVGWR